MYDQKIIDDIKETLIANQQTISVAESVTAGHLQVALASAENASKFFQGGLTAYNLGQKAKHLNIEPIHAESCNCVSEKVAIQMALQVNNLFTSDWGISVTGYAAVMPQCSINELFAYYAITFRDKLVQLKKTSGDKKMNPMKVQIGYVNQILADFHRILKYTDHQSSFSISDRNSINSKLASAGPLSTSPSIE